MADQEEQKKTEAYRQAILVDSLLTDEDREFRKRLWTMIDNVHGAYLGSSIELLIRAQGVEQTKSDLNFMVDSVANLLRATGNI